MDLQALADAVPDGSILRLPPGTHTLNSTHNALTLEAVTLPDPGVRPAGSDVVIVAGDGGLITRGDLTLRGVELRCTNPARTILQPFGRFVLDRSRIVGDPQKGARRGIALNCVDWQLVDSVITDCWQASSEGQAIAGWDNCRDGLISNCELRGGSQAVLFGGGDAQSPDRVPQNIHMLDSDLWIGDSRGWLKTVFELKSCIGLYSRNCTFTGAGTSQGQQAYVIVLKSANQDGHAPWSSTHDVVIEDFTAQHGGGCLNIVGQDGSNPAQRLSNVTIRRGVFSDIDPKNFPGSSGRAFTFQSGAIDVTIEDVAVSAQNMAAGMYLMPSPPVRLTMKNVVLPKSAYGIKIDADGSGQAALKTWAPDCTLVNVVEMT